MATSPTPSHTSPARDAQAALDAPAAAASLPAPTSFEPADDDRVTVLYGYGKVGPRVRHWLDDVAFVGGVARHVPYPKARAWKKLVIGKAIHILPDDADEVSFAKASGIQPMAPAKLAAMIEASDIDAIFAALGPERAGKFARELRSRLGGK